MAPTTGPQTASNGPASRHATVLAKHGVPDASVSASLTGECW